jgi:hypothetical protein
MSSELFRTTKSVENSLRYNTLVSWNGDSFNRVSSSKSQTPTELLCD